MDIARGLDLPLEKIEAVFCNHVTHDLRHIIRPGDAVAFVPRGTPGPHRYFLGIYSAGRAMEGNEWYGPGWAAQLARSKITAAGTAAGQMCRWAINLAQSLNG